MYMYNHVYECASQNGHFMNSYHISCREDGKLSGRKYCRVCHSSNILMESRSFGPLPFEVAWRACVAKVMFFHVCDVHRYCLISDAILSHLHLSSTDAITNSRTSNSQRIVHKCRIPTIGLIICPQNKAATNRAAWNHGPAHSCHVDVAKREISCNL